MLFILSNFPVYLPNLRSGAALIYPLKKCRRWEIISLSSPVHFENGISSSTVHFVCVTLSSWTMHYVCSRSTQTLKEYQYSILRVRNLICQRYFEIAAYSSCVSAASGLSVLILCRPTAAHIISVLGSILATTWVRPRTVVRPKH